MNAYTVLYDGPSISGRATTAATFWPRGTEEPWHHWIARLTRGGPVQLHARLIQLHLVLPHFGSAWVPSMHDAVTSTDVVVAEIARVTSAMIARANGVVFVADSQSARLAASAESLGRVHASLTRAGRDVASIPFVVQVTKRDTPLAGSLDQVRSALAHALPPRTVFVEAHPALGIGTRDALATLVAMIDAPALPFLA